MVGEAIPALEDFLAGLVVARGNRVRVPHPGAVVVVAGRAPPPLGGVAEAVEKAGRGAGGLAVEGGPEGEEEEEGGEADEGGEAREGGGGEMPPRGVSRRHGRWQGEGSEELAQRYYCNGEVSELNAGPDD